LHVGRALQEFGQVEIVVVDAEGGGQEWATQTDKEFSVAYSVPVHPRPKKHLGQKLKWMLDPYVNYPHGCGVNEEATQRMLQSAREFDLIWFCKLRTPNMFPRWAWERSVTDVDDVPSTYERSILDSMPGIGKRVLAYMRFNSWRRRDRRLGERFSVLGVCSELDKSYLQSLGVKTPLHVIPNGYDKPSAIPIRKPVVPPRIGFIGILDYAPNLEGINWFVDSCWPHVKREVPTAQLRLVGRCSDGPLKPAGRDVEGLGWVGDPTDEISTWSAMVVPIHTGAGTRGKIAHAFSLKCPVVSTQLGAYGYDSKDGHELFLADSPEGFANACVRAIKEPIQANLMAERAWESFLQKWTWDSIRPRIWAAAEDCLRLSARHP
jgi:glycosyltransferase involved in cell wall biosynthesis